MAFYGYNYYSQGSGYPSLDFPEAHHGSILDEFHAGNVDVNHVNHESAGQNPYYSSRLLSETGYSDFEPVASTQGDLLDSRIEAYAASYANSAYSPLPQVLPPQTDFVKAASSRVNNFLRSDGPWTATRSQFQDIQFNATEVSLPDTNHIFSIPEVDPFACSQQDSGYHSVGPSFDQSISPSDRPLDALSVQGSNIHSPDMSPGATGQSINAQDGQDNARSTSRSKSAAAKETKQPRGGKRVCNICLKESKCPSDHRKHMLTHDKPHKCDVPGCARTEGFGTTNDLDRHKASVHKITARAARKWKCAVPSCKDPNKLWPRLDNFKQHLERMHKGVDIEAVIQRSEVRGPTNRPAIAIEAELGGIGAGAGSTSATSNTLEGSDVQNLDLPHAFLGEASQVQDTQLNNLREAGARLDDRLRVLSQMAAVHQNLPQPSQQRQFDPKNALKWMGSVSQRMLAQLVDVDESNPSAAAFRTIRDLAMQQETARRRQATASSSDESSNSQGQRSFPCKHKGCKKVFKRPCELRKHEDRHSKPWVCTAAGCDARSGTKYDWQRHERNCNHHGKEFTDDDSSERLRLCLAYDPKSHSHRCGFVHTNVKFFKQHLEEVHSITDKTLVNERLTASDMKADPGHGWCGFCLKVVCFSEAGTKIGDVRNIQTGYGRYTSRADHIAAHVQREGRSMDAYVSLEHHIRSGEAKPENLARWFNIQRPGNSNPRIQNPERGRRPKSKKRKRNTEEPTSGEDERRKKRMDEAVWICCICENYYLIKQYDACIDCHHHRGTCCLQGDSAQVRNRGPYAQQPPGPTPEQSMAYHHEDATPFPTRNTALPHRLKSMGPHAPPHDAQLKYGLNASSDEEFR